MANYIIRLKLKSKDEPEHLHFTAIEEAVNLFTLVYMINTMTLAASF